MRDIYDKDVSLFSLHNDLTGMNGVDTAIFTVGYLLGLHQGMRISKQYREKIKEILLSHIDSKIEYVATNCRRFKEHIEKN